MNERQTKGQLNWLSALLTTQKNKIADIVSQLKGFGIRAGTSLGLHRKFITLLEQVTQDREKELDILHEIEQVEKRHGEMKQRKLLRRATPQKKKSAPVLEDRPQEEPERNIFLELLALFYLFSRQPAKQKNHDLTLD